MMRGGFAAKGITISYLLHKTFDNIERGTYKADTDAILIGHRFLFRLLSKHALCDTVHHISNP